MTELTKTGFNPIWQMAKQIESPYMPEHHASILFELASTTGGTIVEIGSWLGRSSLILGQATKNVQGQLYCVDHWNLICGMECVMENDIWQSWNQSIQAADLDDTVIPLRSVSSEAAEDWPLDKDIDLLFIDGIHSFYEQEPLILTEEVIRDYKITGWQGNGTWLPPEAHRPNYVRGAKVDYDCWAHQVRPGGFLVMHDVNTDHPGTLQVWEEEVVDSKSWLIKQMVDGLGVAQRQAY